MTTLRAILQDTSKLGSMTDAELKKQLKALRQIELVSMQAKIPIQDIDILKIFRAKEDSNKIVTAPREINKRLFDFQSANKAIIQRASLEDVVKHEKRIMANAKKYMTTMTSTVQRRIDNANANIREYQNSLSSYEKRIADKEESEGDKKYYMREMASIKDYISENEATKQKYVDSLNKIVSYMSSDGLVKDIAKVSLNGFWKFISITGLKLHFATVNDVIIFEKSERSGLNIQKNMGRFICEFNLANYTPRILPLVRNITVGGHIHPYVSSCKAVCFGNANDYYSKAAQATDLVQCMSILGTVLSTYSTAGGPYVGLSSFLNAGSVHRYPAVATKYLKRDSAPIVKRLDELLGVLEVKPIDNGFSKTLGSSPRRRSRFTRVTPMPAPRRDPLEILAEDVEFETMLEDVAAEIADDDDSDSLRAEHLDEMLDFDEDEMIDDSEEDV